MNGRWKWVTLGLCVAVAGSGCVGAEPTAGNDNCDSFAGTWALAGTCATTTSCTVTQTGCSASFTCDDGTHSTSASISGSHLNIGATTADGTQVSCSGDLAGRTFSVKCTPAGMTQTCDLNGTNTSPVGTGGTSGTGGFGGASGESNAGGRPAGNTGGNVSGGGGGPPGSCPLSANASACGTCFKTNCTAKCNTCGADADCSAALVCFAGCGSDTAACDACTAGLPTASNTTLTSVVDCLTTTCASACATTTPSGKIGDPCTTDAECTAGTCSGKWCSTTCTSNATCGADSAGKNNACVTNAASTKTCFPTCTSAADCTAYAGTTCQAIVGGTGTICANAPVATGTSSNGFVYSSATCASCATTNCNAEGAACAADPACVTFYSCAFKCTSSDMACTQACIDPLSSASVTTADDMLTCLVNSCSSCGVPE